MPGVSHSVGDLWKSTSEILLDNDYIASADPLPAQLSTCSDCHSFALDNSLVLTTSDTSIDNDVNSVTVFLSGVDSAEHWWRYSLDDGPVSEYFSNPDGSALVDLGIAPDHSETRVVKFCISSMPGSGARTYNCDKFSIVREAPEDIEVPPENAPPQITKFPGNVIFDLASNPEPVNVEMEFTFDASRDISVVVDISNDTVAVLTPVTEMLVLPPGMESRAYRVQPGVVGTSVVTVTATDTEDDSLTVTDSFNVKVIDTTPEVDSAPVISVVGEGNISLNPGESASIQVTATDDSGSVSFGAVSADTSKVTVSPITSSSGEFEVVGVGISDGTEVEITATDSIGQESSVIFTVSVNSTINNPIAVNDTISLESRTLSQLLDVIGNDTVFSGDDISVVLGDNTTQRGGQLVVSGSFIKYTPPANLNQNDSFAYSIKDGGGRESAVATVTLIVPPPPEESSTGKAFYNASCASCHDSGTSGAPVIGQAAEWQRRVNQAGSVDAMVDRTISGYNAMPPFPEPAYASADVRAAVIYLSDGVFPDQDSDGIADDLDNCLIDANPDQADGDSDGVGDVCDATVGNANLPPVAEPDNEVIVDLSGQLLDVLANDMDPERSNMSISLDSNNSQLGVSLVIQENKVFYRAPAEFSQLDSFGYKALDDKGLASSSVTVTVSPSDQDSDGVFDSVDNCIRSPNRDQSDTDSDGSGDLCDPTPLGEDTSTEITEEQVARGRELVNEECIACHLVPSTGAPQFNDEAAWSERLNAAGSIESLVESTINGMGNLMPAFGDQYSAAELTEAVIYLGGYATSEGGSTATGSGLDADDDGVLDSEDNCPGFPNDGQADSDLNGVGDACEPEYDADGDGYVFALDDDDGNARRLPGRALSIVDAVYFLSNNDLSLGEFARYSISASGNRSGGVLIDDAAFISAAQTLYPAVEPALENRFQKSLDIIDLEIKDLGGSSAEVIIQLYSTLPIRPQLSVYQPQSGQWSLFVSDGVDQLASAQSIEGGCPVSNSPNYIDGLGAGLRCIRVRLTDGGVYDSDGRNGVAGFIATLGGSAINEPVTTVESVSNGSRSGGGNISPVWLVILAMSLCFVFFQKTTVSRCKEQC